MRPSAVPLPPPTGLMSPQLTSRSQASRATSRPQTRPGVTDAPDTEADVLADVRSRTYSAYAAGKDRASGARSWAWVGSRPGSYSAVRRVAAKRRERGRDEGLEDAVMDAEKGSGAGSGQERGLSESVPGVGTWTDGVVEL